MAAACVSVFWSRLIRCARILLQHVRVDLVPRAGLGGELLQQLVVAALGDTERLPGADSAVCGLAVVEDGDRGLAAHVPACCRCAHGRVESRPQEPFEQHRRGRPRVRRPGSAGDPLDRPAGRRPRWRRLSRARRRLRTCASGRAGGAGTGFPRTVDSRVKAAGRGCRGRGSRSRDAASGLPAGRPADGQIRTAMAQSAGWLVTRPTISSGSTATSVRSASSRVREQRLDEALLVGGRRDPQQAAGDLEPPSVTCSRRHRDMNVVRGIQQVVQERGALLREEHWPSQASMKSRDRNPDWAAACTRLPAARKARRDGHRALNRLRDFRHLHDGGPLPVHRVGDGPHAGGAFLRCRSADREARRTAARRCRWTPSSASRAEALPGERLDLGARALRGSQDAVAVYVGGSRAASSSTRSSAQCPTWAV